VGRVPVGCDGHGSFSRLVPESVKFGYALRGTDLIPVARGAVEFGRGRYRMLEAVESGPHPVKPGKRHAPRPSSRSRGPEDF